MILLDTNVVVRIVTGEGRIGRRAREALNESVDLRCSTMVQWEIAMLATKGRLRLGIPVDMWLEKAREVLQFGDVSVSGQIARDAGSLPDPLHGDPCDRIMIATARALACPLITTDRKILDYAAEGHLQVIDAGQ